MMAAEDEVYTTAENEALARCEALFGLFPAVEGTSGPQVKYDERSRRLVIHVQQEVPGATPQEVIAYLMEIFRSKFSRTILNSGDVRDEMLEEVSGHHIVGFKEFRAAGYRNRTFLQDEIWRQLPGATLTFIWASSPRESHRSIRPQDEQHAVRASCERCIRVSALPSGTLMESVAWTDLRAAMPTFLIKALIVPTLLRLSDSIVAYFTRVADEAVHARLEQCTLEIKKLFYVLLLGILEGMSVVAHCGLVRRSRGCTLLASLMIWPLTRVVQICRCRRWDCTTSSAPCRIVRNLLHARSPNR
jgi:hypothetical protein